MMMTTTKLSARKEISCEWSSWSIVPQMREQHLEEGFGVHTMVADVAL